MESISLRAEQDGDAEFLFALYASTREAELSIVPWTTDAKEAFLRSQFALQTHHYKTYSPEASFDIILHSDPSHPDGPHSDERAGRLYVDRNSERIHVIDIALLPAFRGKGIGTFLLNCLLDEGAQAKKPVTIYVEFDNPAQRLYHRLGFRYVEQQGLYLLLRNSRLDPPEGDRD